MTLLITYKHIFNISLKITHDGYRIDHQHLRLTASSITAFYYLYVLRLNDYEKVLLNLQCYLVGYKKLDS